MATPHLEVESKLAILADDPQAIADEVADLDQLGGYHLRQCGAVSVDDLYFDNAEQTLESKGIALRLRSAGARRLLTLKGPEHRVGATLQRDELEREWGDEGLALVGAELARHGVMLARGTAVVTGSIPAEVLADLGLVQVQDRKTQRRRIAVTRSDADADALAELAVDSVEFRFGDLIVPHHELEVELEGADHISLLEDLVQELLDRWPALKVWHHSKFATGKALKALLAGNEIRRGTGNVVELSPAVYGLADAWLRQQDSG